MAGNDDVVKVDDDDDDDDFREFTRGDRKRIRRMVRAYEFSGKLKAGFIVWIKTIGAVALAATATYTAWTTFIKPWFRP